MPSNKTLTLPEEEEEHNLYMLNQIFCQPSKGLHFTLFLLCIIFALATCGQCATSDHLVSERNGLPDPLGYEACWSYGDNYKTGVRDFFASEVTSNNVQEKAPTLSGLSTCCTNSALFCFPSTLPGFLAEEENYIATHAEILGSKNDAALPELSVPHDTQGANSSWFSNRGSFILLNGKMVLCSMISGFEVDDASSSQGSSADWSNHDSCGGPSLKHHRPSSRSDEKSELIKLDLLDGYSSPKVEINPRYLDWGQNYLYFPSSAFLTVANTCNHSIIQIYEPFSTDPQFYPCNSEEVSLEPGEVASICFVFLPRQLGLLSAHVILQTSSGGFVIQAKGFAVESLYRVQPLMGTNISLEGKWSKNLSLYNPFDDILHVKEITAWISVSSENISHSAEAVCKMDSFQATGELHSFFNGMEWLDIKSDEADLPMVAIRPHKSWQIEPRSTETIMEINFLSGARGKVSGAFSMKLESSSQDRVDTVVVPLEAQVAEKAEHGGLRGSVLVYLEPIVPCDGCGALTVVLSLRNRAKYLLKVANISEVTESTKLFHIKYMDGLLLFPDTVTRIAVVTYSCLPSDSQDPPNEGFKLNSDCKLLILTNDSGSPQTEVSCQDIVKNCGRYHLGSYIGQGNSAKSNDGTVLAGTTGNVVMSPSQSSQMQSKSKIAEADELVLRSWMSQGATSTLSVLDDTEVIFPVVPVGGHYSKWITVKNPTERPVVMQIILNSGAVIDQCRPISKFVKQSLSISLVRNESTGPAGYGFSMAGTAVTEAYVRPYGKAIFGPIIFHPSDRCTWTSSALIRNNLSGVEWLPLQGFGGSTSLTLLEGSKPVNNLDFNLNMPMASNVSPHGLLFYMEDRVAACSIPLSKELYAKNTGDLPLEVRKIEVSGTNCGLDGFMVHTCKAFALEPGESRRLLITYQTDFSSVMVHRNLELTLTAGSLVIPMKATLPVYILSQCRKSFFWILLKRITLVTSFAAAVIFMVSWFVHPLVTTSGTQDYLFKTKNGTISRARKPHVQRNQKNSKFSLCNNMDGTITSVREDETSKLGFAGRYSDCRSHGQESRRTGQSMKQVEEQVIGVGPKTESPMSDSGRKPITLGTSCSLQAAEIVNLTVRVGKERTKRRRNRRSAGTGTGITAHFEVSSSQSGNSTPSSPRSPVTSFTSKQTWPRSPDVDHVIEGRNPFAKVSDKSYMKQQAFDAVSHPRLFEAEVSRKYNGGGWSLSAQPQTPPLRNVSKAVLLPSATFPCRGRWIPDAVHPSPLSPSAAAITSHVRAPGSNLGKQKTIIGEKASPVDKFAYDIWGNHFPGLHLVGRMEVSKMTPIASGEDSQSFFAMGPQTLVQSSEAKSVSPVSHDVTCFSKKGE